MPAALLCRRATFDAVLRRCAEGEPGVSLRTGHVDGLMHEHGRIRGVTLSGRTLTGDVVIDASGRASRFTGDVRPPAEGGDCGAVYVDRLYQFHDGAPAAPVNSPIGLSLNFPGYFAIAFLHDDRTFSITFAHDGTDRGCVDSGTTRSSKAPSARYRDSPSGSTPATPGRSPRCCPAASSTTPTEAKSTPRAGWSRPA